jgi:hypothetical protein
MTLVKVQAKRPIPEISKLKVIETNVEDVVNDLQVNIEHVGEGVGESENVSWTRFYKTILLKVAY